MSVNRVRITSGSSWMIRSSLIGGKELITGLLGAHNKNTSYQGRISHIYQSDLQSMPELMAVSGELFKTKQTPHMFPLK